MKESTAAVERMFVDLALKRQKHGLSVEACFDLAVEHLLTSSESKGMSASKFQNSSRFSSPREQMVGKLQDAVARVVGFFRSVLHPDDDPTPLQQMAADRLIPLMKKMLVQHFYVTSSSTPSPSMASPTWRA